MTCQEAIQIIEFITRDKVKNCDAWKLTNLEAAVRCGMKPDVKESKFLQEVYRYTHDNYGMQDQPFKPYQRKTSRGIL